MSAKNVLEARLFAIEVPKVSLSRVKLRGAKKAFDSALLELPQILDWLALATSNGMTIYQALWQVGQLAEGKVAMQLRLLCAELEYGASFEDAIENLRARCKSPALSEFCNRLVLTLQRGTPVASQLRSLAASSRASLRNQLLARAGANEIKLLLPLVFMILPVTVWFAVFPSLQMLQFGL